MVKIKIIATVNIFRKKTILAEDVSFIANDMARGMFPCYESERGRL